MKDKIYAYLKLQKGGIGSSELVEQVLKIKGASSNISEKLIGAALVGDRRFALDEQHRWKIIERIGTPLSESEFVFLSVLTVDTARGAKVIVEISAQKTRDDKIIDRLHAVINPGSVILPTMPLPEEFTQAIKEGVALEKAVQSFCNFAGEAVLVGYDMLPFIKQLNGMLAGTHETMENAFLCLKFLAKRLIPNLRPKSIHDIASFYKLTRVDNCRTEKEVGLVADIFSRFTELLKKQGIDTLEKALEFQYPDIDSVDFSKYAFDKAFLWVIPQKPGIYKMKDKAGAVIYVGKAKNLRTRINSYFWNTADRLQKVAELLNTVYSIEYEETGSELAAMLMEFRLIRQLQPKLNQQLEVHERAARYGSLKNFIVIVPASLESSLVLFFIRERVPLEFYEILKDAVNFADVENILDALYFNTTLTPLCEKGDNDFQNEYALTDIEQGEIDIVMSWVDTNKDYVNYINVDSVSSKNACLKLIQDYIRDEETPRKKHFRCGSENTVSI